MPFASVNGIEVWFELHGCGQPLLYISGTGNDLRRSPASVLPVNRAFETLHYDQRGLGRTSKPGGEYTMADYADDAAALVHSMGWASAHVLGVSFGGMVALNLALRHPDVVDRLVLCCTSPGGAAPSYPLHELGRLEADDIAPLANSELLAERIPDSTLRVFEGGHIFMVQDRTAFPAIIDFLGAGS